MAGTPSTLRNNRLEIDLDDFGFQGSAHVLAPEYLFATKLRAVAQRGRDRDVRDIAFLIRQYGDEIAESNIFLGGSISGDDQVMFLQNYRRLQGELETRNLCDLLGADYDEFLDDEEEEGEEEEVDEEEEEYYVY
jgi:Nucleotidyl transferase AbiEii toxin, Type IV TA system